MAWRVACGNSSSSPPRFFHVDAQLDDDRLHSADARWPRSVIGLIRSSVKSTSGQRRERLTRIVQHDFDHASPRCADRGVGPPSTRVAAAPAAAKQHIDDRIEQDESTVASPKLSSCCAEHGNNRGSGIEFR